MGDTHQDWDDLRVALAVARAGTVSGAAAALGLHHATVIRRVDALEQRLGLRLFQRAARGYVCTAAGQVLLDAGGGIEERIAQMQARMTGEAAAVEGVLVLTALPDLGWLVMPRLAALTAANPGLRIDYRTDARLFRLDAGEAHVAIRAGKRPAEPDYVVQPFEVVRFALYGAPGKRWRPATARYILPEDVGPSRGAPFMPWIEKHAPPASRILTSNEPGALKAAIAAGLGFGFLPRARAGRLNEVMHRPEWDSRLWLVTHVDLHRSPKVQAALAALKG